MVLLIAAAAGAAAAATAAAPAPAAAAATAASPLSCMKCLWHSSSSTQRRHLLGRQKMKSFHDAHAIFGRRMPASLPACLPLCLPVCLARLARLRGLAAYVVLHVAGGAAALLLSLPPLLHIHLRRAINKTSCQLALPPFHWRSSSR